MARDENVGRENRGTGWGRARFDRATEQVKRNGGFRLMKNSDAFSRPPDSTLSANRSKTTHRKDGSFEPSAVSLIRAPWTDELERRRKAVARWRGEDASGQPPNE
jgi:hypothetical protein